MHDDNPTGDSASDGDAQCEGRGVQRGVPAARGWYSCVRPRSRRTANRACGRMIVLRPEILCECCPSCLGPSAR